MDGAGSNSQRRSAAQEPGIDAAVDESGEDGLVAGGLSGRDVPRVGEVPESTRLAWFLVLVAALPATLVATGAIVAARRRRDAA